MLKTGSFHAQFCCHFVIRIIPSTAQHEVSGHIKCIHVCFDTYDFDFCSRTVQIVEAIEDAKESINKIRYSADLTNVIIQLMEMRDLASDKNFQTWGNYVFSFQLLFKFLINILVSCSRMCST